MSRSVILTAETLTGDPIFKTEITWLGLYTSQFKAKIKIKKLIPTFRKPQTFRVVIGHGQFWHWPLFAPNMTDNSAK